MSVVTEQVAVNLGSSGPERRGLELGAGGVWEAFSQEVLSASVLETQPILGVLELPTPKSLLLISARIW